MFLKLFKLDLILKCDSAQLMPFTEYNMKTSLAHKSACCQA